MKDSELWEILISLVSTEISLEEAHDRISKKSHVHVYKKRNDKRYPYKPFRCDCGDEL